MNPMDRLGEEWLQANDPTWKPLRDFDHKAIGLGTLNDVMDHVEDPNRGGQLVEHGTITLTERLCAGCSQPFAPRSSTTKFCGELCRGQSRREYLRAYQRDLMRQRRAA